MKKVKNNIKALFVCMVVFLPVSVSFSQTSKDTVKLHHGNDRMNVNPGKVDDGMAVKPGELHDGMSVMSDTAFLAKNIMDNRMEIELSKLGQSKGTDAATKKVAALMVTDHTALLSELEKMGASKLGVSANGIKEMAIPDLPDGKEFDAAWAGQMLTMHNAKITELERFLTITKDPSLRATVLKALPKIKAHKELLLKIPGAKEKSGTTNTI